MDGFDILIQKIERKISSFQSIAFSYEFEAKNISKIELEKWHFNTESYGLVVKVMPMLPYNFGPPPPRRNQSRGVSWPYGGT